MSYYQSSIYGDLLQETSLDVVQKNINGVDITIVKCSYKIPWRRITENIGFAKTIQNRILSLNKQFHGAHIKIIDDCAGWITFNAKGIARKTPTDESKPYVGKNVARAKATKLACSIAIAIMDEIEYGFTKDLRRAKTTYKIWRKKKSEYIERQ